MGEDHKIKAGGSIPYVFIDNAPDVCPVLRTHGGFWSLSRVCIDKENER
jgi:hypothetical protein